MTTIDNDKLESERNLRFDVLDTIKTAVTAEYRQVRLWTEHDVTGPLGGISSQLVGALAGEDGAVLPVCIVIYSDDRIRAKLESLLEATERDAELRARLGWA